MRILHRMVRFEKVIIRPLKIIPCQFNQKSLFFKTVTTEGVFPRKTFSMGEAFEKRYYMEAKRITSGEAV